MSEEVKKTGQVIVNMTVDEDALKRMAVKIIEESDFVKVVRCKDCKKRNTRTCIMNNIVGMNKDLFDDDYCSYGERKE